MTDNHTTTTTFWGHLEVLRWCIVRIVVVVVAFAVVAFLLKDQLFDVVLAPRSSQFVTYRLLGGDPFNIDLINTALTGQFMTHVQVALYAGLLLAVPYVLYELFRFVSPGLYRNERRAALWVVGTSYAMFVLGTLVDYFLVFPLTVRFLGTYQVAADVANMLTLSSYVDTLVTMSLVLGVVFELPVVCAVLGRMGFISGGLMRRYRRHAIVAIVVIAAIITPTGDAFTLMVVSVPIWLLYELSIWLVPKNQ